MKIENELLYSFYSPVSKKTRYWQLRNEETGWREKKGDRLKLHSIR
jgi:hypothetical protein